MEALVKGVAAGQARVEIDSQMGGLVKVACLLDAGPGLFAAQQIAIPERVYGVFRREDVTDIVLTSGFWTKLGYAQKWRYAVLDRDTSEPVSTGRCDAGALFGSRPAGNARGRRPCHDTASAQTGAIRFDGWMDRSTTGRRSMGTISAVGRLETSQQAVARSELSAPHDLASPLWP